MSEFAMVDYFAAGLDLLATLQWLFPASVGVLVIIVVAGVWWLSAECLTDSRNPSSAVVWRSSDPSPRIRKRQIVLTPSEIMKRVFIVAMVAVLSAVSVRGQTGNDLFQKALSKERVDGQLTEAITLYERVVKEFGTDRALAAKALLQIGRCYERLGQTNAESTYERIVRDYSDQQVTADEARARLSALNTATARSVGMSSRQVWTLPTTATITGTVSHDGRYLPYTDWSVPKGNAELFLHDLRSGTNRQITHDVTEFGLQFVEGGGAFSPDDAQFAYAFFNKDIFELRIVSVQGPSGGRSRVLFRNAEVSQIWPDDWSADGKFLAVQLERKDKTSQIGLVDVRDGSLRILKSIDWRGSSKLFFSPDGKYIAYDLPGTDARGQRDVFVLAVDGSRGSSAVQHPSDDDVVGWSPDGRRLLFISDRTGSPGLWDVAFVDGRTHGAPQLIKADVAGASMGVTSRGTLFSYLRHSSFAAVRSDIHVAAFDFERGAFASVPAAAVNAFVGANNFPAWSPDGRSLAFLSRRGRSPVRMSTAIAVLSLDKGELRDLPTELSIYVGGARLRWSPDGRWLALQATDGKGRQGIFRVDVQTGDATPIVLAQGAGTEGVSVTAPLWAPDGKRIYYNRVNRAGAFAAIVERDLSSAEEKVVFRKSIGPAWNPHWLFVDLSPDGQYLAAVANEAWPGHNPGNWDLALIPTSGGEAKELLRGQSTGAGVLAWAPDSRSVFVYALNQTSGNREVWQVAIDGSAPKKLGLNVNALGPPFNSDQQLSVHPDGTRVAFAATEPAKAAEVWALENFLQRPAPRSSARRGGR